MVVLPFTAALSDIQKSVSLTQLFSFAKGKNVIGRISYTYGTHTVGSANIVYYNKGNAFAITTIPNLTQDSTGQPSGDAVPVVPPENSDNQTISGQSKTEGNQTEHRKALIIGISFGCICFFIGIYFIFVELPYRRKRAAYLNKRRNSRR